MTGLIDSEGHLVERYEYTPYGQRTVYKRANSSQTKPMCPILDSQRVTADSTTQPYGLCEFGFQGLMHEEEVGIIHNRARYVHPFFGMMSRDPEEYIDGPNLYEVEKSSPLNHLDPTGRASQEPTAQDLRNQSDEYFATSRTYYPNDWTAGFRSFGDFARGGLEGIYGVLVFAVDLVNYGAEKDLNPAIRRTADDVWEQVRAGWKLSGPGGAVFGGIEATTRVALEAPLDSVCLVIQTRGSRESYRNLGRFCVPVIVTYGATKYASGSALESIPRTGFIPADLPTALPAVLSPAGQVQAAPVTVTLGAVNRRLVVKLEAWRAYKAGGGQLDMAGWYNATKGQYGLQGYYTPEAMFRDSLQGWLRKYEGVNGNSLASPRTAHVYGLYTDSGDFLKWGMSQNPLKRYPKWYMDRLEIEIIRSGPRSEMAPFERYLIETEPGWLNFDRWAGKQVP